MIRRRSVIPIVRLDTSMNQRRLFGACLGFLALPALLCSGLMLWVRSQTTYYVSAYRAASVVDSGSNEQWRRRLYPVAFEYCTLELEWYTYDNPDITAGPYKLFVVVTPTTPLLEFVEVVSVHIHSERGATYTLAPSNGSVLTIAVNDDQDSFSGKTEGSLAFDFEAKEEITTTMVLQFGLGSKLTTETLTLRWKPVRVRYWTSIV